MLYELHTRVLVDERLREAERERLTYAIRLQRRAERATQRARRALSAAS